MPNIVDVLIRVKKDQFDKDVKELQGKAVSAGKIIGLALAGSGGLAMAGPIGAAGLALGAFGAVAIPVITKVETAQKALNTAQEQYAKATTAKGREAALKAEQAATEGLTGSQKQMMGVLSQLKGTFTGVENALSPLILSVLKLGVSLARDLLPAFTKLAQAGGQAIQPFIRAFDQFARSPAFSKIIDQFSKFAVIAGNIVGPAVVQLVQELLQLLAALMPTGASLLQTLVPAIVQLVQILSPAVEVMAKIVDVVVRWANSLGGLKNTLAPLAAIIIAAVAAVKIWTVAQAALDVVLDANPIGIIVVAIGLLIAAVLLLWNHVKGFRDFWKEVWKGIQIVVGDAVAFIKSHWQLILGILTGPIGLAVVFIVSHWNTIRNTAVSVFNDIKHTITRIWHDITGFISHTVDNIVGIISSIPSRIGNIGSRIYHDITGGLGKVASFFGLAHGGVVGAAAGLAGGGLRMVGEQGPELVSLPMGSTVHSNPDSRAMLSGGGSGGINVGFEIVGATQSKFDQFMLWWLHDKIRLKGGGNVQKAFGWGSG